MRKRFHGLGPYIKTGRPMSSITEPSLQTIPSSREINIQPLFKFCGTFASSSRRPSPWSRGEIPTRSMAVAGGRNGVVNEGLDDGMDGLVDAESLSDSDQVPPHLKDVSLAVHAGDVGALRLALGNWCFLVCSFLFCALFVSFDWLLVSSAIELVLVPGLFFAGFGLSLKIVAELGANWMADSGL